MLKELPNYSRWLLYAARHAPSRALLLAVPAAFLSVVALAWWFVRPRRAGG
jgi:hypothetical protein